MKMSKSYYLVESRIHPKMGIIYPNRQDCLIGLFKTEKMAENWIQKRGMEFYGDSKSKRVFFAVLKCPISNTSETCEGAFLRSLWSKEGERIK